MEICSKKATKEKRNKNTKRGETEQREEKVRGTAQESFSHEAQKNKTKVTLITTQSKTRVNKRAPPPPLPIHKNNTQI